MKATNEQLIESYGKSKSIWKTAQEFNMCGQSVHERLLRIGIVKKMNVFTNEEEKYLKNNYQKYVAIGKLNHLAKKMKRTKQFICRKAKELEITDIKRKKIWAEKHGYSRHPFYPIWNSMMLRCYNKKYKAFVNYGAREIIVCKEWRKTPENFIKWLILNGYKKGLSIDRIDNNGSYFPENCQIVTNKEQCRNRRSTIYIDFNGRRITLTEIAMKNTLKLSTVYKRYKRGDRNYNVLARPI